MSCSWSRFELVALMLIAGLLNCCLGSITGTPNAVATTPEQQLNALRVHRQLLQTEIARLYLENFGAETPLLLTELQQRQQEVQLQIDALEGKAHDRDAHNLALNLAADFDYLQQKLDDLRLQLRQLDALQQQGSNNTSSNKLGKGGETTPATAAPSLMKRLISMLRPSGSSSTSTTSSFLRGNWLQSLGHSKPQLQLISAEELLPQLQLQRQFLDDAITRLEQLEANKVNGNNNKGGL